ncbi:hypothetical protein HMPREF9336_02848 [Segniliparus rugosus ATCC BAA-974]|uniref:DNA polymerase IV n=1 Tax=Segniliparus rugosus (strain ATCC BAA-974 / DSM 45345 / CCUG 50838 / CIP 108380 / JCM 13579 / CDC 945) TaxID=679197 RepID=E5XTM6_SEGRC|nr:hypothetical protein HMPREF9336_02848 [Segniliparus rugosus ATCC BAA-974]
MLHVDLDAFFTSVEQLTRPTLRDRPVLVGGTGPRGVVAGASYEARVFGARSAMPMGEAKRLVGARVVVLPPRFGLYRQFSEAVFVAVERFLPVVEQLSFDEAFGEPEALRGAGEADVAAFCAQLRAAVLEQTGLTLSVGAGSGKQLAKIASGLAKPSGQLVVAQGEERAFLAELPVGKLWGVGRVLRGKLAEQGIARIGELAELSMDAAKAMCERAGLTWTIGHGLWQLAQGIDHRQVAPRAPAKQISVETTYETDLVAEPAVRREVQQLAEQAIERLLESGKAARRVTVKIRTGDWRTMTRSATLPQGTLDKQALVGTALSLAPDPEGIGSIRLLGVGFGSLTEEEQLALFFTEDEAAQDGERASAREDWGTVPPLAAFAAGGLPASGARARFHPGQDVFHPEFGHGWVQGVGVGVATVRFETATTRPGPVKSFAVDDDALMPADPVGSLGELALPPVG